VFFEYRLPFDQNDFVHFGKPIGEDGMQINTLLVTQAWNLKKMM